MEVVLLVVMPLVSLAVGAIAGKLRYNRDVNQELVSKEKRIGELEDMLEMPPDGPERVRWALRNIRSHREYIEARKERNNVD